MAKHPATRGTIFTEEAEVLEHLSYESEQYIIKLLAPKTAAHAQAGQFIHIRCHEQLPMRRPMSLMRVHPQQGWIEVLYKVHGEGTRLLSQQTVGQVLSLMGPIGQSFKLNGYRQRPLLLGGGVGIPPMIYLADHIRDHAPDTTPLVFMGSEVPFPFKPRPSKIMIRELDDEIIAAMPLLEDWNIPSRLSSLQGYPGCFQGYITDLARNWLDNQDDISDVEIFSCGPTPMLKAVAALAQEYALPCQISLEEYMACAVGGCAGCTVLVHEAGGPAMRRVCVDGPVFEASQVYPQ